MILNVEVTFVLVLLLLLRREGNLASRLRLVQGFGTGRPLDGALSASVRRATGLTAIIVRFITGPPDAASLLFGRVVLRLLLHLEVPVPD